MAYKHSIKPMNTDQFIPEGLTSQEAANRLRRFGFNLIEDRQKRSTLRIFFEQFNNVLTMLLIVAGTLSLTISEPLDSILIFTIVILNALFGLYQEVKAEEAINALKEMTITKVRVVRDRQQVEIESKEIVPGDIIYLEEGSKIPADGFLKESINIAVNEAALTGESLPVGKKKLEDVSMGTIVSRGRGYMEVTQTGMKTEFGQIAGALSKMEYKKTPLELKIEQLTQVIGIIGILTSVAVMGLSFWQTGNYFSSFLLGISLAVAIVPEGLPAVMTITMSIGLLMMAKRKAILRKLSAIEALGSITVIVTDKTGTLTKNEMRVSHIYLNRESFPVDKISSLKIESVDKIILNGMLCSTASIVEKRKGYDILGDPTEGALLLLAKDLKKDPHAYRKQWLLLDEKPFDSNLKKMTVTVSKGKETYEFSKGAPESILKSVKKIEIKGKISELTKKEKQEIEEVQRKWSAEGYRVLAFSYNGVFQGMMAIQDSPRIEAGDAIQKAAQAGIRVIMVTGDNPVTAKSIGEGIGLINGSDEVILGADIDLLSDKELSIAVSKIRIFARVSPFHKSRLVRILQQQGEIVAVTGDGVNDAVALKQANVGVAMGKTGTDVAKETADIIITDDNFATIIAAIEEGRNILNNLQNAVKYLLSTNLSEALIIIGALLAGIHNLFEPVQILYINLISDGIPALAMAFSPKMTHLMLKKPDKQQPLLKTVDLKYIGIIGFVAAAIVMAAYQFFNHNPDNIRPRTAAFTVLALIQSFVFADLWVSHRSFVKNRKDFLSGVFILGFGIPFVLQFIILQVPFFAHIFHIAPISVGEYLTFTAIAGLIVIAYKGFHFIFKP